MMNEATFCIKVIPAQSQPHFVYVDALSEEDALRSVVESRNERQEDHSEDFAQVGVFFTDHMLHQLAKGTYVAAE